MAFDQHTRRMLALVAIVLVAGFLSSALVRSRSDGRAQRIDADLTVLSVEVAMIVEEQEGLREARRGCADAACDAHYDTEYRRLERHRRHLQRRMHRLAIIR
jgi:ABC-type uncharacterized transport system substrate-binding protein